MKQYIDKSVLVAEIERRRDLHYRYYVERGAGSIAECKYDEDRDILSILDTLEVKEMDLEKEIQDHIRECLDIKFPTTDIELIKKDVEYTARKFFELGLKAQKGERV